MSEHRASVQWTRTHDDFSYDGYSRAHQWAFPGGESLPASAAPEFRGDSARVNPEEGLVAAASSCHMLTFLAICARKRWVVDSYSDDASGYLEKNAAGKLAITRIVLRPKVVWAAGTEVTPEQLAELHHSSHEHCFIANSIRSEVSVET